MTCCRHCRDAADIFDERSARRELRRYRRKGPKRTTRLLLEAVRSQQNPDAAQRDATLLDIGGGIGVIQHELLEAGVKQAVHVDASPAYLRAAEDEALRRGRSRQLSFIEGDFVEIASDVAPADVVTLDRVICCYPYMERLVRASAGKSLHLYALVLPRVHWGARAVCSGAKLYFRLRRSTFRPYLHDPEAVDAVVKQIGFRRTYHKSTLGWHVVTYARN